MRGQCRPKVAVRAGVLVVAPALVWGCQGSVDNAEEGWLRARIVGAIETVHEGTGDFYVGSDPRQGIAVQFTLNSDGVEVYAGQVLTLFRPGKGRPGEGVYTLAPLEVKDGSLQGFTAYFHRTIDGESGEGESFTTVSGEVVVTKSSAEWVEGDFRFKAVLYCRSSSDPQRQFRCVGPNTITPGAPEIEVTGSFAAAPLDPGAVVGESRRTP